MSQETSWASLVTLFLCLTGKCLELDFADIIKVQGSVYSQRYKGRSDSSSDVYSTEAGNSNHLRTTTHLPAHPSKLSSGNGGRARVLPAVRGPFPCVHVLP